MRKTMLLTAALLGCLVFASGCAVGRRTLPLTVPQSTGLGAEKGSVFIGEVADSRPFENKPKLPSVPSIDGDVNKADKSQLANIIGRQRGGYGNALGDIGLPDNGTVMAMTRQLLEEGLRRKGYAISREAAGTTATVQIDQFWAWVTPGMWTVSFEADITCRVTLTRDGAAKSFTVRGYALNRGGSGVNANWQKAYDMAFADFLTQLDRQLTEAGL